MNPLRDPLIVLLIITAAATVMGATVGSAGAWWDDSHGN
jgi:hypothetical protein